MSIAAVKEKPRRGNIITVPDKEPRERLSLLLESQPVHIKKSVAKGEVPLGLVIDIEDPHLLGEYEKLGTLLAKKVKDHPIGRLLLTCSASPESEFVKLASKLEKHGIAAIGTGIIDVRSTFADAALEIARWVVEPSFKQTSIEKLREFIDALRKGNIDTTTEQISETFYVGDNLEGIHKLSLDLRSAKNGRLDAKKIAELFGMTLTEVASIAGISKQSLSDNPTSKKVQSVLEMFERISRLRDLSQFHREGEFRKWFKRPLPILANNSAYQTVLNGDLERPAEIVDRLLTGDYGG